MYTLRVSGKEIAREDDLKKAIKLAERLVGSIVNEGYRNELRDKGLTGVGIVSQIDSEVKTTKYPNGRYIISHPFSKLRISVKRV